MTIYAQEFAMTYLFLAAVLGAIPAFIAQNKGRSAFGWWVFGFLLFPIALVASVLISKEKPAQATQSQTSGNNSLRRCPHCAELIQKAAKKCKHCHEAVDPIVPKPDFKVETWEGIAKKKKEEKEANKEQTNTKPQKSNTTLMILGVIAVGISIVIGAAAFMDDGAGRKTQKIKYDLKTEEEKSAHVQKIKELALEGRYQDAFDMTYSVSGIDESELAKLRIFVNTEKEVPDLETILAKTPPTDLDQYEIYAQRMYIAYNRERDKSSEMSKNAEKWFKKWKQARIDALYARVKEIPSYKIKENMAGYEELVGLDPDNKMFLEKYRYYESKQTKPIKASAPTETASKPRNEILIPRSMSDKGRYYLVDKTGTGTSTTVVVKRVGVYDTIYTRSQIDCGTRMYKVLGEGMTYDTINNTPGNWARAITGSSKSDLLKFICK